MEIETRLFTGNMIRLKDDLIKWIGANEGDILTVRDDTNKKGQRYIAIWKKGE
jgi:hypothetical protein